MLIVCFTFRRISESVSVVLRQSVSYRLISEKMTMAADAEFRRRQSERERTLADTGSNSIHHCVDPTGHLQQSSR